MFEDMVVSTSTAVKTNKPWTVVVSMIFQVTFLAVLILIPLIYTEALPKGMMTTLLVAPPPPPPPPPPPVAAQVVHVKPQVHLIQAGKLVAPKVIPKDIKNIKEEAEPDMGATGPGVPGGVAGGSIGGVLGGVMGGMGAAPPPPKVTPSRIRQGGNVTAAKLVNQVQAQLSAAGSPDPYIWHRAFACDYRQGRHRTVLATRIRASFACAGRLGRRQAVALPADFAQW